MKRPPQILEETEITKCHTLKLKQVVPGIPRNHMIKELNQRPDIN